MHDKKDSHLNTDIRVGSQAEGFLSGNHIAFVFKKVERLATAVYLLSNLWNDSEPMKWKLRDRNLCLLEEASKYHYSTMLDRSRIGSELVSRIAEIVSMFEIAFSTGLISEMNLRVIKEEYLYLIKLVEEKNSSYLSLPKNFFENSSVASALLKEGITQKFAQAQVKAPEVSKGHEKVESPRQVSYRKEAQVKPTAPKPRAADAGNRRQTILSLIKARGEITVKDAVGLVSGVSEKTIQRELIAMTSEGLLKKTGERRWSRYSIK